TTTMITAMNAINDPTIFSIQTAQFSRMHLKE
ncbi:unnamed protein product, partial [marine sediment metagenome]